MELDNDLYSSNHQREQSTIQFWKENIGPLTYKLIVES